MGRYIGKDFDTYGNIIYVSNFDGDNLVFSTDARNALLLTDDDKKEIGKFLRKNYRPNIKYIKLERFDRITSTTEMALRDYEHDFIYPNVDKYASKKDDMSIECKSFAEGDLNGISTFGEFGVIVADRLIEKFNLKKKELLL